ncbi:CTP synthase [Pseudofrankia sp. DC12]|uniref:CTP synthase C-terminal region-related (seleno)protein n=1 Tax=Pseudofrankia sp. DC12 TaxID=683315 RepID=UPI0005F78A19|nr:CTP synthase [Pseudofrankia sp. DC12]
MASSTTSPSAAATPVSATARVALVGDRSADIAAHGRVPAILRQLRDRDGLVLDAYWVPTPDAAQPGMLDGFDAVWLLPGSPYVEQAGAVEAARHARTGRVPFLGTCGGFQHAVVEYARNVCGLTDAGHAEVEPEAADHVVVPLECSLKGHEAAVRIERGSLAEWVFGVERTVERYHCSYGVSAGHLDRLRAAGLRFSGVDEAGGARVLELADHPFFLATLFQPELASDRPRVHPVIRAFATAAISQAARRRTAKHAALSDLVA